MTRYSLIYADPAWSYNDKANAGKRGASHKYPCMSLADICALPVADIAADNCLLAMWHVPAMPAYALAVVEAWGFRLATMKGFTWVKTTVNGKQHFGMGNYTRANSEDCLFAVRGRWNDLRVSRAVRQVITAPVRAHSQKPDEAAERLLQLVGDVPRIELFARVRRPGWMAWGNEVEGSIQLPISRVVAA